MNNIKKENKVWKYFKITIILLFIIFLINYYNINNGYYEKKISEKVTITQENINEFENDIKNREYIDTKKYNKEEYIDTNNTMSTIGYKVSENINDIVTKRTKDIINFLKKLFS